MLPEVSYFIIVFNSSCIDASYMLSYREKKRQWNRKTSSLELYSGSFFFYFSKPTLSKTSYWLSSHDTLWLVQCILLSILACSAWLIYCQKFKLEIDTNTKINVVIANRSQSKNLIKKKLKFVSSLHFFERTIPPKRIWERKTNFYSKIENKARSAQAGSQLDEG